LDWLEDDKFAFDNGDAVTANVVAISRMDGGEIRFRKRRRRRQAIEQELSVWILMIGGEPVERRWNWASGGAAGGNEGASDELGGRISGVNGSKEMDIDEMVDEAGAELERAAGGENRGIVGWRSSRGEQSEDSRRS
jgi:hypothetical protein